MFVFNHFVNISYIYAQIAKFQIFKRWFIKYAITSIPDISETIALWLIKYNFQKNHVQTNKRVKNIYVQKN